MNVPGSPNGSVTLMLKQIEQGNGEAVRELYPIVYEELRRLAKWKLSDERADHSLQPTALVNEAYLRLVGSAQTLNYHSRKGFFVAASEAMRHILVDAARRKLAGKRGGNAKREKIEIDFLPLERPREILDVHDALDELVAQDASCAELVKLHYFGGYSLAETAELLSISRATANRWWTYAKAFLKTQLME